MQRQSDCNINPRKARWKSGRWSDFSAAILLKNHHAQQAASDAKGKEKT
jgi:hypothetical protein